MFIPKQDVNKFFKRNFYFIIVEVNWAIINRKDLDGCIGRNEADCRVSFCMESVMS